MHTWNTSGSPWLRRGLLLGAVVAALALAACGSSSGGSGSSGNAQTLLKQTFATGKHVKSGVLGISFTLNPSGSSTFTTPISFSINGPFQSRGAGHLPTRTSPSGSRRWAARASSASSPRAPAGTSPSRAPPTSCRGRLPAPGVGLLLGGGSSQSSGGLSGLGINPQHWLTNASVVGSDTVGGADTTHIRAGVNVSALLQDINTLLDKASSSTGTKLPSSIPQATQQKIAAAIKNATVDIWTGNSDKVLRKLSLNLNVPVTGQALHPGRGHDLGRNRLTLQYSDLNQPQTITAPTNVSRSRVRRQAAVGAAASRVRWVRGPGLGRLHGSAGSTGLELARLPAARVTKYTTVHPVRRVGRDEDAEVRFGAQRELAGPAALSVEGRPIPSPRSPADVRLRTA